jgi:predicted NBD/HSP70 family sugar kinase
MPGWDGYPIRERFTEGYGVPVWVDNDVNVMTLGEVRGGLAAGHQHVVFVKVGTGVGAGIISNGVIHRGAQGSAGDVGHIQVNDNRVCRCGKVGCLEAVAGGAAIAAEATELAQTGQSRFLADRLAEAGMVTAEDVGRAAAFGDPSSVQLLQRSGRLVGRMLASIVNFFNPSLVVIGGGMSASSDDFLASIRETVYARSLPLATRDLQIQRSALGGLAGVIGAAAMVSDQLFSEEFLGEWVSTGGPQPVALRLLVG